MIAAKLDPPEKNYKSTYQIDKGHTVMILPPPVATIEVPALHPCVIILYSKRNSPQF